MDLPGSLGSTLQELDLYDNLISHIRGLGSFTKLTSLDLSFNKIKHIKNVDHLANLRDLYFVQNRIQKIEGLDGLTKLRNLELAANRIRVCHSIAVREPCLFMTGDREYRKLDCARRALVGQKQDYRA